MLTTILMLIAAPTPFPADACVKNEFGWSCKANWISELSAEDQRVALSVIYGGLKLHIKNVLTPNVKSRRDACWVLSIQGFSGAMLAMASTKNQDLKQHFNYGSGMATRIIDGELSASEGETLLAGRHYPIQSDDGFRNRTLRVEKLYGKSIANAESTLITNAKIAASSWLKTDGNTGICGN